MEHENGGSKILYYGSLQLVWTCNTVLFMSPYVSFVFLIKRKLLTVKKNLRWPDISVLVYTCIFHEITILEHLFLERCFAEPLLFLLEIYEYIDNWAFPVRMRGKGGGLAVPTHWHCLFSQSARHCQTVHGHTHLTTVMVTPSCQFNFRSNNRGMAQYSALERCSRIVISRGIQVFTNKAYFVDNKYNSKYIGYYQGTYSLSLG